MSKNRPNEYVGVNKIGKNIKKSPLHQPNFSSTNAGNHTTNNPAKQQLQPQVYNISKTDFRSVVQQLTASPLHSQDPLPPRPPNNQPKNPSNRLQRIRPPPLGPINRPIIPNLTPAPLPAPVPRQPPPMQGQPMAMAPGQPVQISYNNNFARPPYQFRPPSPGMPPFNPNWPNPALSPISAYMQQLQSCINDPSLMPSPQPPLLPSPQFQPQLPVLPFPSPTMNGPPLLPSPNSQFYLPSPSMASPSNFFNLLSPTSRSPYPFPFPSPGSAFPPLIPNFSFPPMGPPGILGPGPQPPFSLSHQWGRLEFWVRF
ncbi:hypothetical protein V2J09_010543 [Rumex salicifolius]